MEDIINLIQKKALEHDKLDPAIIAEKKIMQGLRYPDGSGVIVGITSKGQVIGRETRVNPDGTTTKVPCQGKLIYCGYDVDDIVKSSEKEGRFAFEETVYLLMTGELPTQGELNRFSRYMAQRRSLHPAEKSFILQESKAWAQMNDLHVAVSNLYKFDSDPTSIGLTDVSRQCIDIIAKFPAIVAYNYCAMKSMSLIEPREDLSIAENFLYMLSGKEPDEFTSKLLDTCLVLHAEHGGGNNSTFATRVVTSSQTNTYMAISTGIASLAGHLHGGANEAVVQMMDDIKGNVKDWNDCEGIEAYLKKMLAKEAGDRSGKIYGIGHAVYTLSDPRAVILKDKAKMLAKMKGREDEFMLYEKVADIGQRLVSEKTKKAVPVNVDFYAGFVYDCMGLPREIYTPIFAMSRVTGWCAHRIEEIVQGKIIRPSYATSLKDPLRAFTPINQRLNNQGTLIRDN